MSTTVYGTAQEALMATLDDDNVEIEFVHRGVGWMQEARDALARRARDQRGTNRPTH